MKHTLVAIALLIAGMTKGLDPVRLCSLEFAGVIGLGFHLENSFHSGAHYWPGLNAIIADADIFKNHQSIVKLSH